MTDPGRAGIQITGAKGKGNAGICKVHSVSPQPIGRGRVFNSAAS